MNNSTKKVVDKQEIIDEVANETGIDKSEIKKIWMNQYAKLSQHISQEKETIFKLLGIGAVIQKHKPSKNPFDDFEL